MTRSAVIRELRADLEQLRADMWQLSEDLSCSRAKARMLQGVIDRQDETIISLWALIEANEREAKP